MDCDWFVMVCVAQWFCLVVFLGQEQVGRAAASRVRAAFPVLGRRQDSRRLKPRPDEVDGRHGVHHVNRVRGVGAAEHWSGVRPAPDAAQRRQLPLPPQLLVVQQHRLCARASTSFCFVSHTSFSPMPPPHALFDGLCLVAMHAVMLIGLRVGACNPML